MSGVATQKTLVDVGGYRLAIQVTGTGSPPVICLSCSGGEHEEWAGVVALLAEVTTCVTYGRPGVGGSDTLPTGHTEAMHTASDAAAQLRTLLRNAEIEGPYVLATGSVGGWIGDQFAAAWPDELAGIVLIDPTNLSWFPGLEQTETVEVIDDDDGGFRFSRRLCHRELAERVPADLHRVVVLSSAHGRWLRNEPREWHQPLSLADIEVHWQRMQREWVDRLPAASHVIAHTAGHLVHREEPVCAAHVIETVVRAAREDAPVRFDEAALDTAGARLCRDHSG